MDIAAEDPPRVYVRCNAPAPWESPQFQVVIADADRIETVRSSVFDDWTRLAPWLVRQGVNWDRAAWLVEQTLKTVLESNPHGAANFE